MIRQPRRLLLSMIVPAFIMLWPSDAAAQRRFVRAPRARAVVVVGPRYYYAPWYYYSPRFYDPFFYGYYPARFYDPFFWYGQYPRPYPPYYYGRYDNTGSARLEITPKHAEVYIDGYFVGRVDEFDGRLQRLHVEVGEHELQVYLEGYRTFRQNVRFTRGTTLRIAHVMQPLGSGEAPEPKPRPDPAARRSPDPAGRQRVDAPPYRPESPSAYGTLSLRISPTDAEVRVDGEVWDRPAGEDRFSIDLPEGPHRIEVRKEGYRTYIRSVDVHRGRTVTLNVSLAPGG